MGVLRATLLLLAGCNNVTAFYEPEPDTRERVAVEVNETVEPGAQVRVQATCPDYASRLAFGGCVFGGYQGSIAAVTNAPEVPQVDGVPIEPAEISAWNCTGVNQHAELPGKITAYAVCEAD